jgi:hypothetical protein
MIARDNDSGRNGKLTYTLASRELLHVDVSMHDTVESAVVALFEW